MIDPFDTLQEIGDELGRRATVGTFVIIAGSPEASAHGCPSHLTPIMSLSRIDRQDRERFESYLKCVLVAFEFEIKAFRSIYGECPSCFDNPPAADSAEES